MSCMGKTGEGAGSGDLHICQNIKCLCKEEMDVQQLCICNVTRPAEKIPADGGIRKEGDIITSQNSRGNIVHCEHNIPIILHVHTDLLGFFFCLYKRFSRLYVMCNNPSLGSIYACVRPVCF